MADPLSGWTRISSEIDSLLGMRKGKSLWEGLWDTGLGRWLRQASGRMPGPKGIDPRGGNDAGIKAAVQGYLGAKVKAREEWEVVTQGIIGFPGGFDAISKPWKDPKGPKTRSNLNDGFLRGVMALGTGHGLRLPADAPAGAILSTAESLGGDGFEKWVGRMATAAKRAVSERYGAILKGAEGDGALQSAAASYNEFKNGRDQMARVLATEVSGELPRMLRSMSKEERGGWGADTIVRHIKTDVEALERGREAAERRVANDASHHGAAAVGPQSAAAPAAPAGPQPVREQGAGSSDDAMSPHRNAGQGAPSSSADDGAAPDPAHISMAKEFQDRLMEAAQRVEDMQRFNGAGEATRHAFLAAYLQSCCEEVMEQADAAALMLAEELIAEGHGYETLSELDIPPDLLSDAAARAQIAEGERVGKTPMVRAWEEYGRLEYRERLLASMLEDPDERAVLAAFEASLRPAGRRKPAPDLIGALERDLAAVREAMSAATGAIGVAAEREGRRAEVRRLRDGSSTLTIYAARRGVGPEVRSSTWREVVEAARDVPESGGLTGAILRPAVVASRLASGAWSKVVSGNVGLKAHGALFQAIVRRPFDYAMTWAGRNTDAVREAMAREGVTSPGALVRRRHEDRMGAFRGLDTAGVLGVLGEVKRGPLAVAATRRLLDRAAMSPEERGSAAEIAAAIERAEGSGRKPKPDEAKAIAAAVLKHATHFGALPPEIGLRIDHASAAHLAAATIPDRFTRMSLHRDRIAADADPITMEVMAKLGGAHAESAKYLRKQLAEGQGTDPFGVSSRQNAVAALKREFAPQQAVAPEVDYLLGPQQGIKRAVHP